MKKRKEFIQGLLVCVVELVIGVLLLLNPSGFTSGIIKALGTALAVTGLLKVLFEQKITRNELHAAISTLPYKQAKRIYAHFLLGMKKSAIAKAEGVSWHSVDRSIHYGLASLAKKLNHLR